MAVCESSIEVALRAGAGGSAVHSLHSPAGCAVTGLVGAVEAGILTLLAVGRYILSLIVPSWAGAVGEVHSCGCALALVA